MQKPSSMCKSMIYFMILMMLVSSGCSVTAPTLTPERLQLVNGEIEACLLLSAAEVEAISGIQVTSEIGSIYKPATCGYNSVKDGEHILVTFAFTDVTLKRMIKSSSTIEEYESEKRGDLMNQKAAPGSFKVEDVDNIGDKAYFVIETDNLSRIQVLKNKILYWFISYTHDNDIIGYDTLLKLVKIALPRMP